MRFHAGLLVFLVAACGNAFSSPKEPLPGESVPVSSDASAESWFLDSDLSVHIQLTAWAKRAGWRLAWNSDKSWMVAAPAEFRGPFDLALQQVITQLYAEGKGIKVDVWPSNRYAEVTNANAY